MSDCRGGEPVGIRFPAIAADSPGSRRGTLKTLSAGGSMRFSAHRCRKSLEYLHTDN